MKYYLLTMITGILMTNSHAQPLKLAIPLGGNSWVTVQAKGGKEKVTDDGWMNWENSDAVFSTYVKLMKPGTLRLSARMRTSKGESKIQCAIDGISKTITITADENKEYSIGEWNIEDPGYIKIDMKGISKTGNVFAHISELHVEGASVNKGAALVKDNQDHYFYWGRRGPSVHMNYDLSEINDDIEWFYNEITVPVGNDPVGSYFMATGFGEGYFGMQVNSPTERRVLFSVWSPFATDDPKKIPADKKIALVKKGKHVHVGEFGDEGSGGQSYLRYNWKAGETYKFLLNAKPVGNDHTVYTAYFYDTPNKQWLLIASFSRPATNTYLRKLHSFLENFDPETGWITRKAFYSNQWVRTKAGKWKAITKMRFTGDATANKGFRLDYDGGEEGGKFYLRNCGFFNDNAVLKSEFSVTTPIKIPEIDFSSLE